MQLPGSQDSSPLIGTLAAAALLLFGIWTPIVGGALTALEIGILWRGTDRPEEAILCAAITLSIAMLGPGVWSVDAVLFGRHRLKFPEA